MSRYDWRAELSPEMSRWMAKYLDKIRQVTKDLLPTLEQIDQIMLEHKRSDSRKKALLELYEKYEKGLFT